MGKILTVVIAAYNKEHYLEKCLNSVLDERVMNDVEILIINDGSKDRTLEIAQQYEKRYPDYYIAIDKENGNYGSVMNKGLELARGKYFRTLDADDWYDTEEYVKFVEDLKHSDADLVLCDARTHFEKTGREQEMCFDKTLPKCVDMPITSSICKNKSVKAWTKVQEMVYKTEVIRKSGLRWIEKISYTDTQYCYWPLRCVETVRFSPYQVYVYLEGIDEQSMSAANVAKNYQHFLKVAETMVDNFYENYNPQSQTFSLQAKFIIQIMHFVYSELFLQPIEHFENIVNLHNKLVELPGFKPILFSSFSQCGICYIKGIENRTPNHVNILLVNSILKIRQFFSC